VASLDKKIKIYTEKKFLPEGLQHLITLYPYWGQIEEPIDDPDFGRFDFFTEFGKETYLLADNAKDADVILLPAGWNKSAFKFEEILIEIKQISSEYHKPILIFFNNDSDEEINVDFSIIFRTSFYKSKQRHNEFAMPGWSIDFLKYFPNQIINYREKQEVPSVGYCGYIDYNNQITKIRQDFYKTRKYVKDFLLKGQINFIDPKGFKIRGEAVRIIRKNKKLKNNIIIRNGFRAAGVNDLNIARLEYANTIINSDYSIVARGAGNFSYRLYEILSCGRIPVFINTDCVLPFDHIINWKEHCLWIEKKDLKIIDKKILEFHNNIHPEDFLRMQKNNRKLYEEWISPMAFHKKMADCIFSVK